MKRYVLLSALLLILLSVIIHQPLSARHQRTTRPYLKSTAISTTACFRYDTLHIDSAKVKFTGYDKPLRSRCESLFVANNSNDTIKAMRLSITYYDTSGNMLHQREVDINTDIIPGQRRMVDFPSWDKQQVFYYIKSAPSSRTQGQATPYTINLTPKLFLGSTSR